MDLLILALLGVLCVAVGLLVVRSFRARGQEQTLRELLAEQRMALAEALQRQGVDLAERIARSAAEVRLGLAERLGSEFQSVQERIEGRLSQGRSEMQEGLVRSTQALEARFSALQEATRVELEGIRKKLDERLEHIGEQVRSKLDQNLREGFQHMEKVQEHLRAAELQLQGVGQVGASIKELNALLRLPHLRGGFGEATLERLLSDFLPGYMFELQAAIPGVGRVDALVKFPKASLPIDSKFPREQVLPLFDEAATPERLLEARKALGQVLRNEATRISRYIRPEAGTMDMALMFLPSETLYFEAIRDGRLWEELARKRVHPVSPNTLAVTLRGVALAQQYYEMARNVERTIEEVRRAQRHFDLFQQRFEEVGKGIEKAQEAFRTASTHLGRYTGAVGRLSVPRETSQRDDALSADPQV
ncbi:MAG: DNA recombination protein RmuC [Thermodesulfobacteriota bacterium]